MSTTIDQKVVEMRFDNKHFEQNVSKTMSTLDKLKQKLHLDGATKGLENVNTAAKKVDMTGLGTAVESVGVKFSALQVMGVTALTNLTNSAVNAGKRIVSALTIDPVRTGFSEYETQINAVQTILANTQSKGTTLDDVNQALDTLNAYADKTIYNFTEMTRNIGTFTAAGVDLDTSVNAIQGIANLAAVSGSTSQQASTAMYQLSQALASGTVKLMDWNSVVNAGMGGQVFQDALMETARVHGIAIDSMIEEQGSFRETLSDGWLTSEILTETLQKFTLTTEGLTEEQIEANREMLRAKGYTEDQIDAIFELGRTSTDAATKVKTFTQLWDVLKEAAQSGWTQTWELIVGDFEEAKSLLTPLADFLTGFVNKMSETRNRILQIALDFSKPWTTMMEKINGSGVGKIKEIANSVGGLADKLEYYQDVVNKVWRGDFNNVGDDPDRFDLLTKAGYDPRVVQDLVNKGYQYKLTVEDIEASHEKFGLTMKTTTKETGKASDSFVKLTKEQLKNAGLTEEEIALYRAMEKEADRLGISVGELADEMSKTDGRSLLIDSFKNLGDIFIGVGKAAKEAWVEIFNPPGAEVIGIRLYGIIKSLNKFTEKLRLTDKETGELNENGKKIQRTLKGVFALIDLISTILGGGLKIAFKVISELLGYFNLNILDVTAAIGDAIVKFRDWFDSMFDISGVIKLVAPAVENAVKAVRDWIKAVKDSEAFKTFVDYLVKVRDGMRELFGSIKGMDSFTNLVNKLSEAGKSIREWFKSLKDSENIPADIIKGFAKGIKEGAPEIVEAMFELGKEILKGICEVLGIHSPSTEMVEVGENTTEGFVQGVQNGASKVWETIKGLFTSIIDWIKNIDFGKVFAVAIGGGILYTVNKIINIVDSITSPLAGLGDIFENVADVVEDFGKSLKKNMAANRFKKIAQSILIFAVAIGILAASVYLLAQVEDGKKLWNAVGVILAIAAIMAGLAVLVSKLKEIDITVQFGKISLFLIGLTASILLLSLAIKAIASIDNTNGAFDQGIGGLIALIISLGVFMTAYGALAKTGNTKNINKVGGVLLKLSVAILILAGVAKIIAGMTVDELKQAGIGLGALAGGLLVFISALSLIAMIPGKNINKIGPMLLKISAAMLLLVMLAKIIAGMTWDEMGKAAAGLGGLVGFIAILMTISMIPGKNVDKIGSMLLKISGAIAILAITARLIAGMSWGDMGKAAVGLSGLVGIIALLVLVTKIGGKEIPKVAGTLILMSVAIAILAGISVVLSLIDLSGLAKGIVAVGFLSLFMIGLTKATKGASDVKGTFIGMAIAIGVIAAAVIALSFIDGSKLTGAVIAMSVLMSVFSLVVKAAGNMQKAMGSLIVITVAIGVLAGVIYLLAKLPVESVLGTALSLSVLLLALAGAMTLASKAGTKAVMGVGAMALMGLVLGELALILGLMAHFDVTPSMEVAKSLSLLLLSMSGALVILSIVGALGPAAFIGIGALAVLIAGIGGLVVGIGALVDKFPQLETFIDKGIPILEKIGVGLGSFFGGIADGFLSSATQNLPTVGDNLSTFMNNLSGFIEGAKAIDDTSLTGVSNLAKMMALISGASIVDSIASFVSGESSMDAFVDNINQFADAIVSFSNKVKGNIDEESILAASSAGKMLAEMQATMVGSGGVVQWFSGEKNLSEFGTQIELFGDAIVKFSNKVKGNIDEEAVTAAANAGTVMATLQSKIAGTGGVIQWFCGEKNMAEFGTQLVAFGDAIVGFSSTVSAEGAINETAVTAAANAGTIMSKMQETLVGTGGVIQWFCGEKDMATFGAQLVAFGTAIVDFSRTVSAERAISETAITAAANAGALMGKLQSSLEPIGGVVGWFSGERNLTTFGTQIVAFGTALVDFSNTVSGNINEEAITAAANAGTLMAKLQNAIPEDKWFDGKISIDDFGRKLVNFGKHIVDFSTAVSGVDTSGTDASISIANKLIPLLKNMKNLDADSWGVSGFSKVKSIGKAVKSYSESVTGADFTGVSQSISVAKKLKNFIASLAGIDTSGVGSFKSAMNSLADVSIDGFVNAFNGASSKLTSVGKNMVEPIISGVKSKQAYFATAGNTLIVEFEKGCKSRTSAASRIINDLVRDMINAIRNAGAPFRTAGENLMVRFISGVSSQGSKVSNAVKTPINSAVKSIRGSYNSFYNAGAYVARGFAAGIKANIANAATAAASMAAAAITAAKANLRINSPSKEFYEIGDYSGQGFVGALGDYARASYKAGAAMADSAKQGLSSAISRVTDIINSDIDSQPTIRPVLDLSDVQAKSGMIDSMFGRRTLALAGTNIGISDSDIRTRIDFASEMLNSRDSGNANVVAAISELKSDFANLVEAVRNMQLTLDGDTVVGGIINRIDSKLGQIATHKGRGN